MSLLFEERPYSGKTFRPRPEIHLDPQMRTLIVATPWGVRSAARKVIDRMKDYLVLSSEDREATSPFPRLSCLSSQANNLRIATLLANEVLYREENRTEYRAGVELFACTMHDDEFVWLQSGNPQVLLGREGRTLLPLGTQLDLSFDFNEVNGEPLAPLPSQLLGLDSTLNLNINSFRVRPGDKVFLLSHSYLPEELFMMKTQDINLDSICRAVAKTYPDLAFWLGILNVGNAVSEAA